MSIIRKMRVGIYNYNFFASMRSATFEMFSLLSELLKGFLCPQFHIYIYVQNHAVRELGEMLS